MLAIKISFFGNYRSHQVTKKGNFGSEWFLRWLWKPSKFPFLAIVGPIIAYIIYQIAKKGNFISKWFLGQLYQPSKYPFFCNCGSHHWLYKPSKLPKKEILIQNVVIKIAFFGNCGSHCCLYHPSNFLKKEILFRNVVIKNILFW